MMQQAKPACRLGLVGDGAVVTDLETVGYISSAGLRLLLKAAQLAKSGGTKFSVCMSQPAVCEVFEISGFNKIIPSYASREAALNSLWGTAAGFQLAAGGPDCRALAGQPFLQHRSLKIPSHSLRG